jgi:threonine synthase
MTDCIEHLSCLRCDWHYPSALPIDSQGCQRCAKTAPSNLHPVYSVRWPVADGGGHLAPSMRRYTDMLPVAASTVVSLGEGLTPLSKATRLGDKLDVRQLLIKDESRNPTGSHKDRFSAVFVSYAKQRGYSTVATASSGNAGASLAAYAARAGLRCVVSTFRGGPAPMLAQMRAFGAAIVAFENKIDRWTFLDEGRQRRGWLVASPFSSPVIGSHPIGIEGYKTIAFELAEQMNGQDLDWCALPVCYGDALSGIWEGFKQALDAGIIRKLPRLIAAEIYGSLEHAMQAQTDLVQAMPRNFDTTALSIGATQSTFQALRALRQSQGVACSVGNQALAVLQQDLATLEGVFAELSSVAPFAAIRDLRKAGLIGRSDSVAAVLTASGLKDYDVSQGASHGGKIYATPLEAWRDMDEIAVA